MLPDVNPDKGDEPSGGFEGVLVGEGDDSKTLHLLVHPGGREGGREGGRDG